MKYLYVAIAMFFMGCSVKTTTEVKAPEVKKTLEVKKSPEVKVGNSQEVIVDEPKVIKNIGADIPTSCVMWSDGCNVCTRIGNGKASCTTGPECTNKMFSCLQWQ